MRSCLYEGYVEHARLASPAGRFRHSMYMVHVDLDEVAAINRSLRLLRVGRPGVHSVHSRDPLGDPLRSIRDNAVSFLAGHGVDAAEARIDLLTNARVFGHVFNPLSLFYCRVGSSRVTHVVAEVSNTHGERHCYLVEPDLAGRCRAPKTFYVSPFLAVEGAYRLVIPEPADRLTASIELEQFGRPAFAAQISARRIPLSDGALLGVMLRHPLMTWQVSAQIRRHGIGLWRRGVPVVPHGRPRVQGEASR